MGPMDGINVVSTGDAAVLILEDVSDELKELLRNRLAAFCYGAAEVAPDADYYSFEATVTEFMLRYDKKAPTTKVGMIGELVVHVLVEGAHPTLSSSAVYFNKEERSIKKGFDLTFHEASKQSLWYGEVKSGEVVDGQSADEKSEALLKIAAADIAGKLNGDVRRSRWDTAIIDAGLTLGASEATTVKALLRSDSKQIVKGNKITTNVLLAAVVLHELDHCVVTEVPTVAAVKTIMKSGRFDATRALVIQQAALETIVSFLRTELAARA